LASIGLLVLFFLRKIQGQEGRREWMVSWAPEAPTLLTVGVTAYLLVVANLCPERGIGWPWVAYVPLSSWSFSMLETHSWDMYYVLGDVVLSIAIICGVACLTEWWKHWLRRTDAKWYQFHLGTLCVSVFVASILLWAHVAQEGWLSKCMRLDWRVGDLASDLLIAFLLLLVCWVGCEWQYTRKRLP
jgi:hypothetical protein